MSLRPDNRWLYCDHHSARRRLIQLRRVSEEPLPLTIGCRPSVDWFIGATDQSVSMPDDPNRSRITCAAMSTSTPRCRTTSRAIFEMNSHWVRVCVFSGLIQVLLASHSAGRDVR